MVSPGDAAIIPARRGRAQAAPRRCPPVGHRGFLHWTPPAARSHAARDRGAPTVRLVGDLKRALDPRNRLNPGALG
ncbi:MAG: hypothetical protein ACK52I_19835, partial [Pseudomonadota bacterium]